MQTHFTDAQLQDPQIREADSILRKCVHCGFCTATCPTFVLTGDERDSPRGRIWMMRELLETPSSVSADTGYHLDRCLGCLACTTTCPSGVDYHHLIDIGREKIDGLVQRPLGDRLMRRLLAYVIPHAGRFRMMMRLGRIGALFAPVMPAKMRAALAKLPKQLPAFDRVGSKTMHFKPRITGTRRVILMAGCAQRALDPAINASTIRVLNKLGVEVLYNAANSAMGQQELELCSPAAAVPSVDASSNAARAAGRAPQETPQRRWIRAARP